MTNTFSFLRTASLALSLVLLSLAWPHWIPGDPSLLAQEDSLAAPGLVIAAHASDFFSSHSQISGQSVFPIVAGALLRTLLWSIPALCSAFFLALLTAGSGTAVWPARLSAGIPLVVLAPWVYFFTPSFSRYAPALLLAFHWWGPWSRLIGNRINQNSSAPFVQAARARGLGGVTFFWRYRWLPVAPACIAQITTQAAHVLGGSVLLEVLFRRPGLGTLLFESVLKRDLPLVQWSVLCATLIGFSAQTLAQSQKRRLSRSWSAST